MDILHSHGQYRNNATVHLSEQEDRYRTICGHRTLMEHRRSTYWYSKDIALPVKYRNTQSDIALLQEPYRNI